jgi:NADPH:quinone reductase-like Zn-dependent oxidoreductase
MRVHAVALSRHGGPEVLEDVEVDIPDAPAPGHVRVRVLATALNHLDLWVRRGLPHLKHQYPHRLCADVCGVVEAVGEGARAPAIGTRVVLQPALSCGACEACLGGRDNFCRSYGILGEHFQGGTIELFDVPSSSLLLAPAKLSVEECAAIPLTYMTAWQMVVRRAQVKRGDVVLVQSAGSGVSTAAIQIAKSRGARVITTTSSEAKAARARALGADEVIDYTRQDFVAETRKLTGKRGVDVVIEHVGGETFAKSLLALTNGGRLVTCGATSGPTPEVDLRHVFFRQLEILGSTMGSKADLFPVLREIEAGALRPIVDRVLPLDAAGAREASRALEAREAFGKIVLRAKG